VFLHSLFPTLLGGLKNLFNIFLPKPNVSPPTLTGLPPGFNEGTVCTCLLAWPKTTFLINGLAVNNSLCAFNDSALDKLSLGLESLLAGIPIALAKTS
jgi:hypothetical protein